MDTDLNTLSSALLQSIDAMAQSAADSTDRTLTIEAKIVEVIDAGIGTYKVEYLGNTFEATAAHTEIVYDVDEMVYVIVPCGDFDKNKVILSPVSPVTATYASTQGGASFITLGDNLFASVADVELCTYHPHDADPTGSDASPYVNIDTTGFAQLFKEALKDSRTFNFSCRIKTDIDKSRRSKGNYGLVLDIPVIQENTQKFYSVVLDINNIKGDPYNLSAEALQNFYFTLPADMEYDDSRVPYIRSFVVNFMGDYSDTAPNDIWIKDIRLLSTLEVAEDQMTGYYMTLTASQGTSFLASRTFDTKTIRPTIYLNGKVTQLKNFDCYWFKENCLIDTENEKFNRFGGLGWEILNTKTDTVIGNDGTETYQYVTNDYDWEITQESIHSCTRFKCVLVKGEDIVSQTIAIRNLAASTDIQLVSATGSNQYTGNVGKIRLILRYYEAGITTINNSSAAVNYAWQRFDKLGNYIDNNFYTIDRFNEKVTINGKTYFETEISYDTSEVDESNLIHCTVYTETAGSAKVIQNIIGTESILITTGATPTYRVNVINGDKIYKYDADGDSPKVADYDGPLSSAIKAINPIEIILFKPDGTEFTSDEYAVTKIEWLVPVNSLIKLDAAQKTDAASNPGYYTISGSYNNYKSLSYDIANTYNKKKADNTIFIKAYFRDNIAEGVANLRFLKDGEGGTNGSKYSAIVTWNGYGYGERNSAGLMNKMQLIYVVDHAAWYIYNPATGNITPFNSNQAQFKVDLYCDGEKIPTQEVSWTIFDVGYVYDGIKTPVTISTNGVLNLNGNNWTDFSDNYCATIEAKCSGKKSGIDDSLTDSEEYVYAYYPIEMTYVRYYRYLEGIVPTLDGGYDQVIYASDGTNPQYDNSENFIITDSLYNNDAGDMYDYNWSGSSNVSIQKNSADKSCKVTPTTKFDNGAAKNFVRVSLVMSDNAASILSQKISDTQNALRIAKDRLNYYKQLQNAISILTAFNYDSYVADLQKAGNLYQTKTNLVRTLEELLNRLEKIRSLCVNYDDADSQIHSRINQINDIKNNKIANLINYSNQLGINSSATTKIKQIAPSALLIDEITVTEKSLSFLTTVNDSIKRYNNQVNTVYTNYYEQLNDDFVDLVSIVQQVVNALNSYTSNSKWNTLVSSYHGISEQVYLYSGLWTNLKTYINSLSSDNTYSYDKVISNVLKPMKIALDSFKNISYNDNIDTLNNSVTSLRTSLTEYQSMQLPSSTQHYAHIKPIIMLFNRYEMSNINGWDGNKTQVEDGYILSPQVGAGKKDNSNQFTGIVMGVKQTDVKTNNNQRIGMFGFHKGVQSLFLNAEDGSAILGKSGAGQIIIDPSQSKGLLYSSNFFINYNNKDGKPKSYETSNWAKQGMLIDLTTPEIRFGNGNFVVNSDGHGILAGGGTIAGWVIDDSTIHSRISEDSGRIVMDSGAEVSEINRKGEKIYTASTPGKIYSGKHSTLASTDKGFYLSQDGLSVSNGTRSRIELSTEGDPKIYSGNHSTLANTGKGFYVGNDGLSIGNTIRITATEGGQVLVGRVTGSRYWKINGNSDNSYIGYNADSFASSKLSDSDSYSIGGNASSVYIGTDGIRLGKKFAVDSDGNLVTKHLIAKNGGSIGGWAISSNELSANNLHIHSNGSIYTGNYHEGESGWSISSNGNAYFNALYASKSGTIGGWTINSDKLSGGNKMTIRSEGSLYGPGWHITSEGAANFDSVTANKVWSFGSGSNTWSNTGFNYGLGKLGGNTINGNLAFTNGSMTMGDTPGETEGAVGVAITKDSVKIAGDIYANNGYFKGKIEATSGSFKGKIEATEFNFKDGIYYMTMGDKTDHPRLSGMNLGHYGGIRIEGDPLAPDLRDKEDHYGQDVSQMYFISSIDKLDLEVNVGNADSGGKYTKTVIVNASLAFSKRSLEFTHGIMTLISPSVSDKKAASASGTG